MIKILFLCTGNSCRSQMAEGFANSLKSDSIKAFSAGIEKHGLNPYAVIVMKEEGIDISDYKSKTVNELKENFDYVITVCGNAHESCPIFLGKTTVIHRGFDDPPFMTKDLTDESEILKAYRRVRDEIKDYIRTLPGALKPATND